MSSAGRITASVRTTPWGTRIEVAPHDIRTVTVPRMPFRSSGGMVSATPAAYRPGNGNPGTDTAEVLREWLNTYPTT